MGSVLKALFSVTLTATVGFQLCAHSLLIAIYSFT